MRKVIGGAFILLDSAYWPFMPNANAYAERFVRSIKEECLDRMVPLVNTISGGPSQNSWRTAIVNGIIKGWAIG